MEGQGRVYNLDETREKAGNFEWIAGFDELKAYFEPGVLGIATDARHKQRVLVIGCGTSRLSHDLARFGFDDITSVDNDANCVSHMQRLSEHFSASKSAKLAWKVYDMVECSGDAEIKSPESSGTFDLIVDKGTLDAILVEGSVTPMLCEVHRLLRSGGIYVVCSINTESLLDSLLNAPPLCFDATLHQMPSTQTARGHAAMVAICKKISKGIKVVDPKAMAEAEREVMDLFFQEEAPLFTPDYEAALNLRFQKELSEMNIFDGRIHVSRAYTLLFDTPEMREFAEDYTIDLFREDLEAVFPSVTRVSIEECLTVLYEKQ